jgi:hypothetical protein
VSAKGEAAVTYTQQTHTQRTTKKLKKKMKQNKRNMNEKEEEAKKKHGANASPSYIVEKSSVPVHSRRSST